MTIAPVSGSNSLQGFIANFKPPTNAAEVAFKLTKSADERNTGTINNTAAFLARVAADDARGNLVSTIV